MIEQYKITSYVLDKKFKNVLDFFDAHREYFNRDYSKEKDELEIFVELNGYMIYAVLSENSRELILYFNYDNLSIDPVVEYIASNEFLAIEKINDLSEFPDKIFSKFEYLDDNNEIKIFPFLIENTELEIFMVNKPYQISNFYDDNKTSRFDRIFMFGDSYGALEKRHILKDGKLLPILDDHDTWIKLLVKDINPKEFFSYCMSGSGPHYMFQKFTEHEHLFNDRDLIVLIFSEQQRILFDENIPTTQNIRYSWDTKEPRLYKVNMSNVLNFFEKKFDDIKTFYNTLIDEIEHQNIKNLCYFKKLSIDKKINFLIIYSFNDYKNVKVQQKLDFDNFYIFEEYLSNVSENEIIGLENLLSLNFKDFRTNHLSSNNHKILSDNLIKKLDRNDSYNDYEKNLLTIKDERFFYCPDFGLPKEYVTTNQLNFIYD